MGRFLRQYDRDYMKMAMLKQEETFREQVNELHRLYRVQKLLMRDVTRGAEMHHGSQQQQQQLLQQHSRRRPPPPAMLDLELPAGDDDDAADVELTLATGGTGWRGGAGRRKKADSSDSAGSGASFSSSASTESGSGSAGSGSGGESLDVRDWGLWYRGPAPAEPQAAVAVRQGGRPEQRPSWQLQYLSLNMT